MDPALIELALRMALMALFGLVALFGFATSLQLIAVNVQIHRMARQQQETIDGIYAAYQERKKRENEEQQARLANLLSE